MPPRIAVAGGRLPEKFSGGHLQARLAYEAANMPRDLAIWTGSGAPSTRTWRFALWYAGPTSVQVRSALTVRSAQSTEMDGPRSRCALRHRVRTALGIDRHEVGVDPGSRGEGRQRRGSATRRPESLAGVRLRHGHEGPARLLNPALGQGQRLFKIRQFLRVDEHRSGLSKISDRRPPAGRRGLPHQQTESLARLGHRHISHERTVHILISGGGSPVTNSGR